MNESTSPSQGVTRETGAHTSLRVHAWEDRERLWGMFLARAAEGDRDAFAALYDATSPIVYSLVMRILGNHADADEVTADVFVQAWRSVHRFDSSRGGVGSWLVTMARSRALDRQRSHHSRLKLEAAPLTDDRCSPGPSPEDVSVMNQDSRAMALALKLLPPEQRQTIELAYFQGMSHSEISEFLEIPLGTVKTRARLGMMRLRQAIGGSGTMNGDSVNAAQ